MKKFTKVLEDANTIKAYKVKISLELIIETENEGEAGYLADSIMKSIKEQYDYQIDIIEETNDKINENINNFYLDINIGDVVLDHMNDELEVIDIKDDKIKLKDIHSNIILFPDDFNATPDEFWDTFEEK